jgi:hypothetical protein
MVGGEQPSQPSNDDLHGINLCAAAAEVRAKKSISLANQQQFSACICLLN